MGEQREVGAWAGPGSRADVWIDLLVIIGNPPACAVVTTAISKDVLADVSLQTRFLIVRVRLHLQWPLIRESTQADVGEHTG